MNTRVYYYSMVVPEGVEKIRTVLNEFRYMRGCGEGVVVEYVKGSVVSLEYVYREELEEVSEDPFGTITSFKRVRYDRSRILWNVGDGLLQVVNPGRKYRRFLRFMEGEAGIKCSVSKIGINVMGMVERLGEKHINVVVTGMRSSSFRIRERTAAHVEFKSLVDVRGDAKYFLGRRNVAFDWVALEFPVNDEILNAEISSSGHVLVKGDFMLTNTKKFMSLICGYILG